MLSFTKELQISLGKSTKGSLFDLLDFTYGSNMLLTVAGRSEPSSWLRGPPITMYFMGLRSFYDFIVATQISLYIPSVYNFYLTKLINIGDAFTVYVQVYVQLQPTLHGWLQNCPASFETGYSLCK